jgi:hypothetical protein
MALVIIGESKCALCGEVLQNQQRIIGFPAFIADRGDPLYRYSDSAMHRSCFETWTHRDTMIAKYRVARGEVREEEEEVATNVGVLGTPEERAELLEQLRRHASQGAAQSPELPLRCPCCGCRTLRDRGGFEICEICFWEDDGQDDHDADVVRGGPNGELSLFQARANYLQCGACEERMIGKVRPPRPEELAE